MFTLGFLFRIPVLREGLSSRSIPNSGCYWALSISPEVLPVAREWNFALKIPDVLCWRAGSFPGHS